jgi:NAD(P)-dependent dehydrogenase (short-subunit alcohol dehydrogenase family)
MHERNVLIAGASSGIGKATARKFVEAGFRVFGTNRHPQPKDGGVEMLELDLRAPISIENCVAEVLSRAGSIDVLVNNAGVMLWGFAEETTMEETHALFETNFFGPAR